MIKKLTNPCIRCGKERILLKKWVEEIPGYGSKPMKITRALNVCPDAECQKLVDQELAIQKDKRDKIKAKREEKLQQIADEKLTHKRTII